MALIERAMPLSGGAGLNFSIVGGTEEPVNPIENMIWINTDTAIGEWQFSATEPRSRADGTDLQIGDIWIETSDVSESVINLFKKNGAYIGLASCSQWNGTEFIIKNIYLWANGIWAEIGVYWIFYPLVSSKLNNSWAIAYQGTSSTPISIKIDSSTGYIISSGNFYYHSAVDSALHDLTHYKTAYVEIIDGASGGSIGFYSYRNSGLDSSLSFPAASASRDKGIQAIDISGLTGKYYFGYTSNYGSSNDTLTIGRIYLT